MLSLYPVSSFERRLFFLALAKLGDYLSLYGAPGMRRAMMWFSPVFIGIPWVLSAPEGCVYAACGPIRIFLDSNPPDAVTIRQVTAIALSGHELSASWEGEAQNERCFLLRFAALQNGGVGSRRAVGINGLKSALKSAGRKAAYLPPRAGAPPLPQGAEKSRTRRRNPRLRAGAQRREGPAGRCIRSHHTAQ